MSTAVESAKDKFVRNTHEELRAGMFKVVSNRHLMFFHRQFARIFKYTRRGFQMQGLPPFFHAWVCLKYVKGLRMW